MAPVLDQIIFFGEGIAREELFAPMVIKVLVIGGLILVTVLR